MDTTERDGILRTDTLGRVRVSRERREAILDDFEASSLSAAAYARQHGIGYSTFIHWVRKRRGTRREPQEKERGGEGVLRPEEGAGTLALSLAEVELESDESAPERSLSGGSEGLRVELPGGVRLVVGDVRQAEVAAALIGRLRQRF